MSCFRFKSFQDIPLLLRLLNSIAKGYLLYTWKYSPSFYFRLFRPYCQWAILRLRFKRLKYPSFNTTLFGRTQDCRLKQGENNPVYSISGFSSFCENQTKNGKCGFEEMSIYENLRFGKQKSHQKYTIIMSAN